ncbi:MAG: EF-hand domain-containing protein [Planctomycetes bacterium]|nr:EF-hand domain-containing protein [Planctomycetota bacterium]
MMLTGLIVLGGCIQPPTRNQPEDQRIGQSTEQLQPAPRGPVDPAQSGPEDPKAPPLEHDVKMLSSDLPLQRVQADNRLRAAGAAGVLAAARFLADAGAAPGAMIEALRFLEDVDIQGLDVATREEVRRLLAGALGHKEGRVRSHAARSLQVHGPGSQRTAFLQAIGDAERRVRWAVVRRFGDNPAELDATQREVLISFLQVRTRDRFDQADVNKDLQVTRGEFIGSDEQFQKLDSDGDGRISLEEWTAPAPAPVRADVCELLMRLHAKLTPGLEPIGYNPYAPAADQQGAVDRWSDWSKALPK